MTAVLAAALAALAARLALPPGAGPAVRRVRGLRSTAGVGLPGPVLLDLVAAVLRAGAPVAGALRMVGETAAEHGDVVAAGHLLDLARRHDLALERAPAPVPEWVAALDDALRLARETGSAAAPLLAAAAEEERRRRAAAARVAAARLGVRVVLPTGLCLLPAFVLLAVVPLVLALLGSA